MIDDLQIEEMMVEVEGLTGMTEINRQSMEHSKFKNVSDDVGS